MSKVTLKANASAEELSKYNSICDPVLQGIPLMQLRAKSTAESQGGKIVEEFALIKGFTYVFLRLNSVGNTYLSILR